MRESKENMIIVKLTNGFGNNIFQMVAGKLLAEVKGCDLYFNSC